MSLANGSGSFFKDKKDTDPDPDPYLWLMDPDPGGQKHVDPEDPDSDPDHQHCIQTKFSSRDTVPPLIPFCIVLSAAGCAFLADPPPLCWWQDAQSDGLELIHSITSPPQLFPYISLGEMEACVMSMLLPPVTQREERLRETGKEGSHSSCVANGNRGRKEYSQLQQR
jgi:hypothetical protein